jgi:hypothetical protein
MLARPERILSACRFHREREFTGGDGQSQGLDTDGYFGLGVARNDRHFDQRRCNRSESAESPGTVVAGLNMENHADR